MIAPKGVAAAVSLALAVAVSGCAKTFEVPIEIPIQPRMDVSPFSRVLVAGFISGGTDDVDANLETVRLLRSQLRSRSNLRVIEAEVLPLAEIAREQMRARTDVTGTSPAAARPMPSLPLAMQADGRGGVPEVQLPAQPADEDTIRTEADLERYQAIFSDEAFWRRVGEEHQQPLIVTGTVLFTNTQQAGFVNTNREVIDQLGRRSCSPCASTWNARASSSNPGSSSSTAARERCSRRTASTRKCSTPRSRTPRPSPRFSSSWTGCCQASSARSGPSASGARGSS
jgi:hypothetical protein